MEFIAATVLGGMTYDMLKNQIALTADNIKRRLQNWVIDDLTAKTLEDELKKLKLSDELSEIAIERKIESSDTLMTLIRNIKPHSTTTVNQVHTGTGDNIGRDKIVN